MSRSDDLKECKRFARVGNPGSAAHPCLLASVSRALLETQQARIGGAPRQFGLLFWEAS
jgi:hypothetical protein